MSKPITKTSGIRMPTELYSWIDQVAAKHQINRSQCVCNLVRVARKRLVSKSEPKTL